MNILLRLAFDGTNYHGFQVQANANTVCETIQTAMQALFGARPDVKGCSRTDAGVHARAFALSFKQHTAIPMHKLPLALNAHLPEDIRVFSARQVPEGFHARYACAGKEYQYHIRTAPVDDPFAARYETRTARPVDAAAMHTAGQALVGKHDFAAFQAAGSAVADTVRTISALEVQRQGERITLTVAADGFLYNMVRIIAGTLLAVGAGDLPPEAVGAILAGKNRSAAGDTLPAKGLFLNRVFYPASVLELQEQGGGHGGETTL